MADTAVVVEPKTFLHEFEGGAPLREPVVQGTVEGLLGGPDTLTHIAIDLALNPPAIGNPDERFIVQTVESQHLDLNIKIELEQKVADNPEVLSYSWGSTNPEALSTLTGLTDNPDWLIV
jgi:hypothetical protein